MTDIQTATSWRGYELIDRDGDKIGTVAEIYLDQETGEPEWASVKTGLFGTRQSFVPIGRATAEGEIVRVPYEKEQVKEAPTVEPDGQLSQSEEAELYSHYGLDYSKSSSSTGLGEDHPAETGTGARGEAGQGYPESAGEAGQAHRESAGEAGEPAGRGQAADAADTSARSGERAPTSGQAREAGTDDRGEAASTGTPAREGRGRGQTERLGDGDERHDGSAGGGDAMTRSEEEVDIDTRTRAKERVRLKKHVVTDEVTKTVPVKREEVRVEREPVSDANADDAMSGPDLAEGEHEVTVTEEEPVVEKRTVPKERVRLDKDVSVDEREISEDVRRERVDVDRTNP